MKKMMAFLMAVLMLASAALAQEGFPEPVPGPTAAPLTTAAENDVVTVTMKITSPSMDGLQVNVSWDPLVFEVQQEDPEYAKDFTKGSLISLLNVNREVGLIRFIYVRLRNSTWQDEAVASFQLKVRPGAPVGTTEIAVERLLVTEFVSTEGKSFQVASEKEGVEVEITAPRPSTTPTVTPVPTPTPTGSINPTVTPTAEPTATPDPAVSYVWLEKVITEGEKVEPTPTPTPTPTKKPATTPPRRPTATPSPTPTPTKKPSSKRTPTPTPTMAPMGSFGLRTRPTADGFALELYGNSVIFGAMQATITYDASVAEFISDEFSEGFALRSTLCMSVNDEPGELMALYTNHFGYDAQGEPLYTAYFRTTGPGDVYLTLEDVECTDLSADLNKWSYPPQTMMYSVQPVATPEPVEVDEATLVEVRPMDNFTHVFSVGEAIFLKLNFADIQWESDNPEVVYMEPDGLAVAMKSGTAVLSAKHTTSGIVIAQGNVCVRNDLTGLPVEILTADYYADGVPVLGFAPVSKPEHFRQRGITLTFDAADGAQLVVTALLPEFIDELPAGAFAGCQSLRSVEVHATDILGLESGAFAGAPALQSVTLAESVEMIGENAFPDSETFVLYAPEGSPAAQYAQRNGVTVDTNGGF